MKQIEYENRYLASYLPKDLEKNESIIIHDVYFPSSSKHPNLRIRKKGDSYELTKKGRLDPNDRSTLREENIELTEKEFNSLKSGQGKELIKYRYKYKYQGKIFEINIFKGKLTGLVTIEIEFNSKKELESFQMPDFCLVDVTQESVIAGGILAGKSYQDIKKELEKYSYTPLEYDI